MAVHTVYRYFRMGLIWFFFSFSPDSTVSGWDGVWLFFFSSLFKKGVPSSWGRSSSTGPGGQTDPGSCRKPDGILQGIGVSGNGAQQENCLEQWLPAVSPPAPGLKWSYWQATTVLQYFLQNCNSYRIKEWYWKRWTFPTVAHKNKNEWIN